MPERSDRHTFRSGAAAVVAAWDVAAGLIDPPTGEPFPGEPTYLTRPPGSRPPGSRPRKDDRHEQQCRQLLETLRKHCPDLAPPGPPSKPGQPADVVHIDGRTVEVLVRAAATGAAGLPIGDDGAAGVLWVDGPSSLWIDVARTTSKVTSGVIAITVPVRCDQTGNTLVHMTFAVGTVDRPLGLVAATENRPRGPREVVDIWGDALIAFGWQVVLDIAAGTAAHAGDDLDGAPLIPAALAASGDGLAVLPQARHAFDRPFDRRTS